MFETLQQFVNPPARGHANGQAPVNESLGRPVPVGQVGGGHVRVQRGESPRMGTACVRRYALATVQQLNATTGQARIERLAHQGVGHAVAVALDFHVVVHMHAVLKTAIS